MPDGVNFESLPVVDVIRRAGGFFVKHNTRTGTGTEAEQRFRNPTLRSERATTLMNSWPCLGFISTEL
jgi:hypothetical protein